MRFHKILLLLFLITNYCFGQFRFANTDTNYYQIANRFYSQPYTGADTLDEGGPFAQFKKWEMFWSPRLYPTGSFQVAKNVMNDYFNSTPSVNSLANWTPMASFLLTNSPFGSGTGRINRIVFHPDFNGTGTGNTNTIYAGACTGGLWRTTNGGSDWSVLNTDNLPIIGITAIEIDPNINPSTGFHNIFIGTGVYSLVISQMLTAGIYRSDDDGQSWRAVNTNLFSSTINFGDIAAILVNPLNGNDVFAATSLGLYRTSNALTTCSWNLISTSGNPFIRKILYKPNDLTNMNLYASGTDIIKSTNGGSTWSSMTGLGTGLDFNNTTQFTHPNETVDGIHIAVTPAAQNYVYASIVTHDANGATYHYFFKYDPSLLIPWSQGGNIPNIYGGFTSDRLSIAVSPTNKNEIYFGQTNVWKSTNGGTSFASIAGYWISAHADIHDLQFSPTTNILYTACDGGVYRNNEDINHNTTTQWTDLNNYLDVGEQYRLGASPTNSDLVLTGLQDVGSYLLDNSKSPSQKWKWVGDGDGFEQIIASNNLDMFTAGAPNGSWPVDTWISHSKNGWTSNNNNLGRPCWAWIGLWGLPYVLEPSENKIYAGYNELAKKVDFNSYNSTPFPCPYTSDVAWECKSSFADEYQTCRPIQTLAIAPSDKNYIYAAIQPTTLCPGFDGPRLFKTKQGGGTTGNCLNPNPSNNSCWEELFPFPSNPQSIISVAIHPENPEKIWIACSGYSATDKVKVFDGTTWSDYSSGLPSLPVNTIVYEKGSNDGLYVGTDVGVYYRNTSMSSWQSFMTGLPNVIVSELEINYAANKIRAATYGRGLWESNLACPINTNLYGLSGNQNTDVFDEAENDITSSQTLANNVNVTYRAGHEIILTNGFFAPSGSDFHAFIHACNHSGNSFRQQNNNPRGDATSYTTALNSETKDVTKTIYESENLKYTLYPNPFTDHLHIDFLLEKPSDVKVTIYNSFGQTIETIANSKYETGEHTLRFDNSSLTPGVYFVKLDFGDKHYTKAVIKSK